MKHKATIYLNRKMNKELSWTHRKTIKKKVQHILNHRHHVGCNYRGTYRTYAQRTSHIALIPSSTIRQKRDRYAHRLYPQYGKHTKSHTKSALAQLYSVQLCCYFVAATRPYPHKRTRKHTGITQTALLNTAILQPIFQLSLHYNSYYYSAWCL